MSEDCPHCVFEKTEANCRGCFEGSHYKPKPITNADRIRAMTDEELADELLELFARFYAVEWSREQVLDLLKQEATNDP
jgi:hypothetical protein